MRNLGPYNEEQRSCNRQHTPLGYTEAYVGQLFHPVPLVHITLLVVLVSMSTKMMLNAHIL